MYRIRKKFRFEAAHRLAYAYSRECTDSIHGHSYVVEMFLLSSKLDKRGMVLDFGILKDFTDNVKKKWDHALLLPPPYDKGWSDETKFLLGMKTVPVPENPTAEWMAMILYFDLVKYVQDQKKNDDSILSSVKVEKVRVHETQTGWAEFSEE